MNQEPGRDARSQRPVSSSRLPHLDDVCGGRFGEVGFGIWGFDVLRTPKHPRFRV